MIISDITLHTFNETASGGSGVESVHQTVAR